MSLLHKVLRFILTHKLSSILIIIVLGILIFIFRPQPPKPIETKVIKQTNLIQSLSVSGTIAAKNYADLSFITGGLLIYLGAKKGDSVTAGQTIAVLDERTVQKNLETALLNYSEQRNTFDQTQDNNQNRTPEEALSDAMKRILQNNQYDLDKSVKSVELQTLAKEQSVLTTPIAGVLTRTDAVSKGINVNATTTFSVVDPNSLVFNIDVDEADIGKVARGQAVNLVLDPYPDTTLRLVVTDIDFVNHTTSTGGNVYTVTVKLPFNTDYKYRVGMNGNAEVITAERNNVITVPIASIFDNNYVYIKTANHFEKRKVVLGLQNDTDVQVLRGVSSGEQVVLQPSAVDQQKSARTPFFGRFFGQG